MSRPALIAIAAGILAAAIIIVTLALVSLRVSRTLLRWAARHCFDTDELRERFEEEWLADLEDVPGRLAKLAHTVGCLRWPPPRSGPGPAGGAPGRPAGWTAPRPAAPVRGSP